MQAFEDLATRLLTRVGVDEADALAASIVRLIIGTALHRQSGLYTEDVEARLLVSAIRGLVAAHAMGPDGVDRTLAELREAQQ
jgi:hypothetical protein